MQEGRSDNEEEYQVEDRFSLGYTCQEREGGKDDGGCPPESNSGFHHLVPKRDLPGTEGEKDGDRAGDKDEEEGE